MIEIISALISAVTSIFTTLITIFTKEKYSMKIENKNQSKGMIIAQNNVSRYEENNDLNHSLSYIQNVNVGISPDEASSLITNLFLDNFPKLEEKAVKIATDRIEHMKNEIMNELMNNKNIDLDTLKDPDVQYSIYVAENIFARFGSDDMLSILSKLIVSRMENNDKDVCLKVAIDGAIKIAGFLNREQLDYLAATFLTKQVMYPNIHDISDLAKQFDIIDKIFIIKRSTVDYLLSLNCLELSIVNIVSLHSKQYNIPESDIKKIIPKSFENIHPDYKVSHIGLVIAIVHNKNKTGLDVDPAIWIHT